MRNEQRKSTKQKNARPVAIDIADRFSKHEIELLKGLIQQIALVVGVDAQRVEVTIND